MAWQIKSTYLPWRLPVDGKYMEKNLHCFEKTIKSREVNVTFNTWSVSCQCCERHRCLKSGSIPNKWGWPDSPQPGSIPNKWGWPDSPQPGSIPNKWGWPDSPQPGSIPNKWWWPDSPQPGSIPNKWGWPDSPQPISNMIYANTQLWTAKSIFLSQTNHHTFFLNRLFLCPLRTPFLPMTFNLKI